MAGYRERRLQLNSRFVLKAQYSSGPVDGPETEAIRIPPCGPSSFVDSARIVFGREFSAEGEPASATDVRCGIISEPLHSPPTQRDGRDATGSRGASSAEWGAALMA